MWMWGGHRHSVHGVLCRVVTSEEIICVKHCHIKIILSSAPAPSLSLTWLANNTSSSRNDFCGCLAWVLELEGTLEALHFIDDETKMLGGKINNWPRTSLPRALSSLAGWRPRPLTSEARTFSTSYFWAQPHSEPRLKPSGADLQTVAPQASDQN